MYFATIFLPLLGALLVGFGKRLLGERGCLILSCSLMVVATALSILVFQEVVLKGQAQVIPLFTWLEVGTFKAAWALKFDTLSVVMITTVLLVSTMVHIYSVGYMHHDKAIVRFMAYLSLFTFFMLMLVSADNLLQMFFGWEGVGLTSYLLIGFWNHKESANDASMKAFLMNRVGDIGFALGIFAIFVIFKTVTFEGIFAQVSQVSTETLPFLGAQIHALTLISLLLFVGAMGKSAQFGLHTWLPDAMEGPTPVSALIHAATMVTAGVFMLARMSPLLEQAPQALLVIALVGALTAIFAASVAITQQDIKRVIAYSTCSQLGYMVFAIGLSAYSVAIFHLVTHAFFKALLFLGAGAVIHALSDEQDMRKMGGLWRSIPMVYTLMWIGSLALMGIPFFAGYYSKDAILEAALGSSMPVATLVYGVGITVALLTAAYSGRLIFLTFHGKARSTERVMAHVHEPPLTMMVPLVILACGAVGAGYFGKPLFLDQVEQYWKTVVAYTTQVTLLEKAHHAHPVLLWMPTVAGVVGMALSWVAYRRLPGLPQAIATKMGGVYRFLVNKWYVDELYNALFIKPSLRLGQIFWQRGDVNIIDRFGPDGVSKSCAVAGNRLRTLQSGFLFHYALAMVLGVLGILTWFIYRGMI